MWNDPAIAKTNPGVWSEAQHRYRGAPGRKRHHLCLYEPSQIDKSEMARSPRRSHVRRLAGQRHAGCRERRRRGPDRPLRRRDRLRRIRIRPPPRPQTRSPRKPGGCVRQARPGRLLRSPASAEMPITSASLYRTLRARAPILSLRSHGCSSTRRTTRPPGRQSGTFSAGASPRGRATP